MSSLIFLSILAISTNFCHIKIDLSGNTIWPQASEFSKTPFRKKTLENTNCTANRCRKWGRPSMPAPHRIAISENYEFNVVHHKCLFMGKKVNQATLYLSAAASILSYRITITVKPIFHFRCNQIFFKHSQKCSFSSSWFFWQKNWVLEQLLC